MRRRRRSRRGSRPSPSASASALGAAPSGRRAASAARNRRRAPGPCDGARRRRSRRPVSSTTTRRSSLAQQVGRAQMGEQDRGADGRMAGEGQFAAGREDAQPRGVDGIARRQHEDRLRQVEFARDRLHARRVEPVAIEHDGERVAGEGDVGEHVERVIGAAHGRLPSWRESDLWRAFPPPASPCGEGVAMAYRNNPFVSNIDRAAVQPQCVVAAWTGMIPDSFSRLGRSGVCGAANSASRNAGNGRCVRGPRSRPVRRPT